MRSNILVVPCAGHKGNKLIKSMQNNLKRLLPENIVTRSGTKHRGEFTRTKD